MASTPYLTPNGPVTPERYCYRLKIWANREFLGAVKTALLDLQGAWRWEQYGTLTPEECARLAFDMYEEFTLDDGWCMIGAIFPFASADTPENMLLCDGSTHSKADYPLLYDALDTVFIVDSTHFVTPDLRANVVVGSGAALAGYGVLIPGDTGGQAQVTLSSDEMPAHNHTTDPHAHSEITAVATIINGGLEAPAASATPSVGVTGTASPSTNNTGGSAAHDNVQPFVALKYGIVAR